MKALIRLGASMLAIAFAVSFAAAIPASAQKSHLPHHVPDFCASPDVRSVGDGAWSSPGTWSPARVPAAGDRVLVAKGTAVSLDVVSEAALPCMSVAGSLTFRTDRNTRVTVGTLMVMPEGTLTVGTAAAPVAPDVTAEIVIADQPLDTKLDPEQFGTGLIGFGKVTMHGSVKSPTFVRLSAEPLSGQSAFEVSEPPTGWLAGDRLIVPDTRQLRWTELYANYRPQYEEVRVKAIAANQVAVDGALRFDHRGARDLDGKLEFLPHIANLTRNVVVRSANPAGTRGHVILIGRAVVDIRYAQFSHLGRTTIAPLDSTTLGAGGGVEKVGTNQIGRYALHMHHLMGPPKGFGATHQFTLIGNAVEEGPKWGITVHNSHYGLIRDNVVYDMKGASFMAEDGNESFNVFEHNFAMRGRGTGGREGGGREGTGFYFKGPNNIVRDNVATNMLSDEPDAAYGFKYFLTYLGNVKIPKFPGADTSVDGQYETKNANTMAIRLFENNETYGATESGMTYWWVGADIRILPGAEPSTIKNMRVWHVYNKGIFHYPAARMTIDGLVVRGKPEAGGMYGIELGDYVARDITIRRADIQGMGIGVGFSTDTDGGWQLLDESYLRNRVNVRVVTLFTSSAFADYLAPRRIIINNTRFVAAPASTEGPQEHVSMSFAAVPTRNLVQRDQVLVYAFNGVKGDDFEAFYTEQAPDFVVPKTTFLNPPSLKADGVPAASVLGAPAEGLTNAQTWQQHRLAIGGQIAPCAAKRPEVTGGFACPIATPFAPPKSQPAPGERR